MIFRRKQPLSIAERLRGFVWPRSGFARAGRYLLMRMKRMPGSPHSIAIGIASGAAVSCTPLVGFHFVLGFAIAYVLRGNMLAAAIGTAFGNPWTFPFLWAASYQAGIHLFWLDHSTRPAFDQLSWNVVTQDAGAFFWPTFAGAVPVGGATFALFYFVSRKMVAVAQAKRREKREAAMARRSIGLEKSADRSSVL
ncbi:MAG: DUF2062 domain-containing protein [Pseudomonadota bacterium]